MKKLVANLFVLSLISISTLKAGGGEGKDVPTATVEDLNGHKVDFKSMLKPGKFYVISFWATWCVPCKKELSKFMLKSWQINAVFRVKFCKIAI